MKRKGFILLFLLLSQCGVIPEEPEARAQRLGRELRCPVCRGVSIAESPSPLAREMMEIVRQQVGEGKSDDEILHFFEARYGEWSLLKPKSEGAGLIVWILPALFLLGGGFFVFRVAKGRRFIQKE